MRTLYSKPIRHTTYECYQGPMDLETFVEVMKEVDAFKANMQNLKVTEPKFIEQWFETFGAWLEIEQAPEQI